MAKDLNNRLNGAFQWWAALGRQGVGAVQVVTVQAKAKGDPFSDRLLLGPATAEDLARHLLGYPDIALIQLVKSGAGEAKWYGAGIEEGEFLFVPALPLDAPHRGGLQGLVDVVDALLTPETGCPWDLEQTHESLKRFLMEEAHELFDAIDLGDQKAMREEIGDVLLQPLMHARMMSPSEIDSIAQQTAEKLVRRHPHVFGDEKADDPAEVLRNWERVKAQERSNQMVKHSMLKGVPRSLPSLARAQAISERVVRVGFDWPDAESVWAKLNEEMGELREAIDHGNRDRIESELGDLLFSAVQVGRWQEINAEDALRRMLDRFAARFAHMEQHATKPLDELSFEEWDTLWEQAKGASA